MTKTFMEMVVEAKQISQELDATGGELTPLMEQIQNDLAVELPKKVDAYKFKIDRLEIEIDAMEAMVYDLKAKIDQYKQIQDWIKTNMVAGLKTLQLTELEGNFTRVKLVPTAGRTIIEDESLIPNHLKTIETKVVIKKDEVKKEIAMGLDVPGARVEPGESLRFFQTKRGIE